MAYAIPAITAIAAVASAGAAVNSGIQQNRAQKRALGEQKDAQQAASTSAQRQEAANAETIKRANSKKPNVAALLADAQRLTGKAPKTQLTGSNGVPTSTFLGG